MSYQVIDSGSGAKSHIISETATNHKPEPKTFNKISKQQLVNKLNYINFQDQFITVSFRHKKYGQTFSCLAKPQPCIGEELLCLWANPSEIENKLKTYEFENIQLKDSQKILQICIEILDLNEEGARFRIPDDYLPLISEKKHYAVRDDINAQVLQHSVFFDGNLLDFSATSFSVKIVLTPPQTAQWINPNDPVDIILSNDNETLYSGECKILKITRDEGNTIVLLEPKKHNIHRFKIKKFRSIRESIVPLPLIHFKHPFTGMAYDLKVIDLSGSGFSVEEENTSGLLSGLILPEVEMRFANTFKIKFKAQVIYRKVPEAENVEKTLKCGFVFLDISSQDHLKILSVLIQLKNKKTYLCNELDIDLLWNFLFNSGFIYPEKYHYIRKDALKIKETYKKLYTKSQNIARHFTYQNNGSVIGHLAMVRFYENTWLIHHHAARTSSSLKAGLVVLNQIGHFSNSSHSLYSNHMNYLMCFFRPENKFPNRVFGGAARAIKDTQKCDIESLAYFHFSNDNNTIEHEYAIPWNWSLNQTIGSDLEELEAFYSYKSGGLMLKTLDIQKGLLKSDSLVEEYNKIGLKRERHFFSLKCDNSLIAIFMIDVSNMGLNLSDLTNGVKAIVLDPDKLPEKIFRTSLYLISISLQINNYSVLVYPVDYMVKHSFPYEKIYNLWMLDTQFGDDYFRYVNRLTRLV